LERMVSTIIFDCREGSEGEPTCEPGEAAYTVFFGPRETLIWSRGTQSEPREVYAFEWVFAQESSPWETRPVRLEAGWGASRALPAPRDKRRWDWRAGPAPTWQQRQPEALPSQTFEHLFVSVCPFKPPFFIYLFCKYLYLVECLN
jgi:hypothetical protein